MPSQPSLLDAPVSPSLTELLAGESMCARLARFLVAHRGEWIDGDILKRHGGKYAYRTRISDLRHAPWFLQIDNRVRTVEGEDGETFKVSEYRLVTHV